MNYKEYIERRNNLFKKWQNNHKERNIQGEISWDGIVCSNEDEYEQWQKECPKILFLIKEAHGDYNPGEPTKVGKSIGYNIARWKKVINELYKYRKPLTTIPTNEEVFQTSNIGIALVEVKKNDEGNKESNMSLINSFANADREFLKEQIDELIKPNIVFCCGTGDAYDLIYKDDQEDEPLTSANNGKVGCLKHNNRLFINFYHPSFTGYPEGRGGNEGLFDLLCEILDNGNVFQHFNWSI